MVTRRRFIQTLPFAPLMIALTRDAWSQGATLDEKSPAAVALGYVADAGRANKAKFPQFAAGRVCSGCQLYQGKPTDATAPCGAFGNQRVSGKGWCSAWVKRA